MKTKWSKNWIASKNPSKQRKYVYNAPLHVRQKFLHVHLSKELRTKYGLRAVLVRKGDKVIVSRGQHKKKTGAVTKVSLHWGRIIVEGIQTIKKDGATAPVAMNPTNLIITSLNLDDKKRKAKIEKKQPKEKK